MNPCDQNPCENGATCKPNGMSYTCSCPLGYLGLDCETCKPTFHIYLMKYFIQLKTNLDDICASVPCLNGATCQAIADGSDYFCFCL